MDILKSFRLDGRRALVTGSSRGIGRSIALALAQAGAEVVYHGTAPSQKLADAVAEARADGAKATSVTADLADPAAVERLAEVGAVDILVLNASVQKYQSIELFEPEEFTRQFQVNVAASLKLIEAFLPAMRERGWGRVLVIGSVNHFRPAARLITYSATKSALDNVIRNAAVSHSRYGITFNTLSPGVIATDRNAAALADPEKVRMLLAGIPAGHFGQADDCAGAALLLCSDAGAYITGANLPVTGGMHL